MSRAPFRQFYSPVSLFFFTSGPPGVFLFQARVSEINQKSSNLSALSQGTHTHTHTHTLSGGNCSSKVARSYVTSNRRKERAKRVPREGKLARQVFVLSLEAKSLFWRRKRGEGILEIVLPRLIPRLMERFYRGRRDDDKVARDSNTCTRSKAFASKFLGNSALNITRVECHAECKLSAHRLARARANFLSRAIHLV